jgi:hypothetical protein
MCNYSLESLRVFELTPIGSGAVVFPFLSSALPADCLVLQKSRTNSLNKVAGVSRAWRIVDEGYLAIRGSARRGDLVSTHDEVEVCFQMGVD